MSSRRRPHPREKNAGRAVADLHRASELANQRRFDEAVPLLRQVLEVRDTPALRVSLGDCLRELGRVDEARREYERVAATHAPAALRLGLLLASGGRFADAAPHLRRASRRDPQACLAHAYVALQLGEWAEAEQAALVHRRLPASPSQAVEGLLFLGLAQAAQGKLAEAAASLCGVPSSLGRTLSARFHLLGGELAQALEGYRRLEAERALGSADLAHAALAAAWSGEGEQARSWLARAERESPGIATQLAAAQVALAARDPERALAALPSRDDVASDPGDGALAAVLRARALRQLGRPGELRRGDAAFASGVPLRVRALAWVEVAHADADGGRYPEAERAFVEALALDPGMAEAARGRDLSRQRLSWKRELEAGADRQVASARAEVESLRQSFAARDGEIAALRRQLAALERERREAEVKPPLVTRPRGEVLNEELDAREAEAKERAEEEVQRAFGNRPADAPPSLVEIVRQAERMYQKGLQTDLPGAGVAVLFSGALERALYLTMVSELDGWLEHTGGREAFLAAARTADRSGRPSYLDRFVGAFDRQHPQKAPGLGEVARVLARRREAHLAALRRFLEEEQGWPADFLDALGAYLEDVKVKLRDPVAHGHVLDIDEREVRELRSALLHRFAGGPGILFRLAFPRP